jgi:hypothetical protein
MDHDKDMMAVLVRLVLVHLWLAAVAVLAQWAETVFLQKAVTAELDYPHQ